MVGMIVLAATMGLGYWYMDSKCAQLGQEIRKSEQKFAALEDERVREEARWSEKNTPEKLDEAMLQHGIAMIYPAADQVVRMDENGRPAAGQLSLARFKRSQNATERMVKTQPQ
jgi:hypothetical protein